MFIQKIKKFSNNLMGHYLKIMIVSVIANTLLPSCWFSGNFRLIIIPVVIGGYTSLIVSLVISSMSIGDGFSKKSLYSTYLDRICWDIILFVLAIVFKDGNEWISTLFPISLIISVVCSIKEIIPIVSENIKIHQRKNKENEEFKKVIQNHITKTDKRLEKEIDQLEEIIKKISFSRGRDASIEKS